MSATERVEPARPPSLRRAKARAWAAQLWALTRLLGGRFREALRRKRGRAWLGLFAFQAGRAYQRFVRDFLSEQGEFGDLFGPRMERLRQQAEGLQSLLPPPPGVTGFSILIPVYRPNADFFKKALRAALSQGSPRMEILVGLDGPQPSAVATTFDDLRREFPKAKLLMRVLDAPKREGISATTNRLAREARYSHLLFMDHDDWMRPDLLYRYDQILRTLDPSTAVLSCDEYKINEFDEPIAGSLVTKAERPSFPYFFQNHVTHCLLVPKALFERAGRLRTECDGAQDYDLCLRLDLAGAKFQNVPFPLYAWRAHVASTAMNPMQKAQVTESGVRALTDYAKAKGLDWEVREGAMPSVYRATPRLRDEPRLHALMPYKNERDMTLRAAKAALGQRGVRMQLTAVDNGSADPGIAEDLRKLGCEVIRIEEPFNYARLNNQGLARSKFERTELLLFLNNDVVMDPDAATEMARWARQPGVGAVGARVRYPDGKLQHGGIDLDARGPADRRTWVHTECGLEERLLARTMVIRACEAVTAACVVVPREAFERVGGFDEIFYPIAYSDTRLCARLRAAGLQILYTPYATGVHHEGATRGLGAVEDFESSAWLEKIVP